MQKEMQVKVQEESQGPQIALHCPKEEKKNISWEFPVYFSRLHQHHQQQLSLSLIHTTLFFIHERCFLFPSFFSNVHASKDSKLLWLLSL